MPCGPMAWGSAASAVQLYHLIHLPPGLKVCGHGVKKVLFEMGAS